MSRGSPGMHNLFGDTSQNLGIFSQNQQEKMKDATTRRGQDLDAAGKHAELAQREKESVRTQEGWEKQRQHESSEKDKDRAFETDLQATQTDDQMMLEQERERRAREDWMLKQKVSSSQSARVMKMQEERKRAQAARLYELQSGRRAHKSDLRDAKNEAFDLAAHMQNAQTTYNLTSENWQHTADTANQLFNNELSQALDAQKNAGTEAAELAKGIVRSEAGKTPSWIGRVLGINSTGGKIMDGITPPAGPMNPTGQLGEKLMKGAQSIMTPGDMPAQPMDKQVASNIVDAMVSSGALDKLTGSPDKGAAASAIKNYYAAQLQLQGAIDNAGGQPLEDKHPDVVRFQQAAKALASQPGMAGVAVREFLDNTSTHFSTMAANMALALSNKEGIPSDVAKTLPEWFSNDDRGQALKAAFSKLGASSAALDTYANSILPHADVEKESMNKVAKAIIDGLDQNPDAQAKQHPIYKKAFAVLQQSAAEMAALRDKKKFADADLQDTTTRLKANTEKQRYHENALEDLDDSESVLDTTTGLSEDYSDILANAHDEETSELDSLVKDADDSSRNSFEAAKAARAERRSKSKYSKVDQDDILKRDMAINGNSPSPSSKSPTTKKTFKDREADEIKKRQDRRNTKKSGSVSYRPPKTNRGDEH